MITIDTREQKYPKLCEYLADIDPDLRFVVEKLEHGADYWIENESEIGIQRKTVNDFISSLGGLKDTLHDLRSHYDRSALLVEGNWRVAGGSLATRRGGSWSQRIPLSAFHNFVFSQQIRGTAFLRTYNLRETAYMLRNVHNYLDGSVSPAKAVGSPEEWFAQLPNIGPKKAELIALQYDNFYEATRTFPEGLVNVEGIGHATVDNIIAWLQGEE